MWLARAALYFSKMGAEQAIYLSMGLLAMTSLSGLGVAVGSGVVMMMQEEVRVPLPLSLSIPPLPTLPKQTNPPPVSPASKLLLLSRVSEVSKLHYESNAGSDHNLTRLLLPRCLFLAPHHTLTELTGAGCVYISS